MPLRARILAAAATPAGAADLIALAWHLSRWLDAAVDAYATGPTARVAGAVAGGDADIAVLERPSSAADEAILLARLAGAGRRAILLPPRPGGRPWCFAAWRPEGSGDGIAEREAGLLAAAVEQHLRWRTAPAHGHAGDAPTCAAIGAILAGQAPAWPCQQAAGSRRAPLVLRTLALARDGGGSAAAPPGDALVVVPRRTGIRLSELIDIGDLAAAGCRRPADAIIGDGQPLVLADALPGAVVLLGRRRAAARLAVGLAVGADGLAVRLTAPSLLDPALPAAWEALRERLAMPALRAELAAAADAGDLRRLLLMEDL